MHRSPFSRHGLAAAVLSLSVLASACGGGSGSSSSADPAEQAAAEAAATNSAGLQTSAGALDIEVLNVADGSVATLRDAVEGDRPVLVWFWAPH